jgi:hypothetical protein
LHCQRISKTFFSILLLVFIPTGIGIAQPIKLISGWIGWIVFEVWVLSKIIGQTFMVRRSSVSSARLTINDIRPCQQWSIGLLTLACNELPLWFPWLVLRPLVSDDIFLRERDFERGPMKNRGKIERFRCSILGRLSQA